MQRNAFDETRATARLPHVDIDMVHRRARDGDAEQMSVSVQAVPSFATFARLVAATNPVAFWTSLARASWTPWLAGWKALSPTREPERVTAEASARAPQRVAATKGRRKSRRT